MKKLVLAFVMAYSFAAVGQSKLADATPKPGAEDQSATVKPATVDASYVIGAEDVINIAVWKEPDFSSTVPVRPDGKVSLALLGDVEAAGKTPAVLAADLTVLLKKYVAEPRVTVMVTAINSRRVFLLGEVN